MLSVLGRPRMTVGRSLIPRLVVVWDGSGTDVVHNPLLRSSDVLVRRFIWARSIHDLILHTQNFSNLEIIHFPRIHQKSIRPDFFHDSVLRGEDEQTIPLSVLPSPGDF